MRDRTLSDQAHTRNPRSAAHVKNLATLAGLVVAALTEGDARRALLLANQLERHLIEDAANGK